MKEEQIAPGITIVGFESMEEMAEYMAKNEADATKGALDEQWQITWGDRVIRVVDELWIFGEVFTEAEAIMVSPPIDEEALNDEERAELDAFRDSQARGYRYGRWFSTVEPEGEYGSAHVVSLWKITREDFESAREARWEVPPDLAFRVGNEVGDALQRRGSPRDQEPG